MHGHCGKVGKRKSCNTQKLQSSIIIVSCLLYFTPVLSLCQVHGLFKPQLPHL